MDSMILIVDDRPENVLSLKSTLQIHNLQIDSATSGEDALQKILKNSYTLIILDVQMPGMDGFEVAEAIAGYSKTKDIPIIFLSAVNTDKKFITKGFLSGGIDYVTKPVDPDILLLKIKTFSRLYEQTQELSRMHKALLQENRERKKVEEALEEKVNELRSIVEAIPQIAFTATPDGEIEFVNEHWYQYSSSPKNFPEVHPQHESIKKIWDESITKGIPIEREVSIKMLGKEHFQYHLLRALPVEDSSGTVIKWVGTMTDIHAQKKLNEVLEQKVEERTQLLLKANEELEARNYELQQFASVASHDLKEPLRKIQVFSKIVQDSLPEGNQKLDDYLQRIVKSSERMSVLINDLLDYSRLSSESLYKTTDLNRVVREILSDLEILIQEKNAKIEIGELPVIEAIRGQIRQLLQNIISNALKFSKPGVVPQIKITSTFLIEKKIDAAESETGDYCKIEITDNGIGFNETYIEKIFTIFQRLNPKEAYEGTGIGLAIAKKIVDKHNGILTAKSKENEGSTFIIVLPLKQIDRALTQLTV